MTIFLSLISENVKINNSDNNNICKCIDKKTYLSVSICIRRGTLCRLFYNGREQANCDIIDAGSLRWPWRPLHSRQHHNASMKLLCSPLPLQKSEYLYCSVSVSITMSAHTCDFFMMWVLMWSVIFFSFRFWKSIKFETGKVPIPLKWV